MSSEPMGDAEKTNSNRPVEVKASPTAGSCFSREDRLLASGNAPNIATIHEMLEEADGVGDIAPVNIWFDGGYLWM